MRKWVSVDTLDKIEIFMRKQDGPVSLTKVRDSTKVNFDSVKVALSALEKKGLVQEEDGKFMIKK